MRKGAYPLLALLATGGGLLALLMTGHQGGPLPTGTFRGARTLPIVPGTDPVIADQMRRVEVRLGEDGKATLEDGGVPTEGLASRHGDEILIEVLAVAGVNVDRQPASVPRTLSLRLAPDGAIVYDGVTMRPLGR